MVDDPGGVTPKSCPGTLGYASRFIKSPGEYLFSEGPPRPIVCGFGRPFLREDPRSTPEV